MIELLIALLFISLATLIIAHYQFFVIRWQQEGATRLAIVNYAHNFFIDSGQPDKNQPFDVQYYTMSSPKPSSGMHNLIEPEDFTLLELIITWTDQQQNGYTYKIVGRKCI